MSCFLGKRNKVMRSLGFSTVVAVSSLFSGYGCVPFKHSRVAAVALTVQDVANAAARESNPAMVKEGMPAYLMLLDGLIEAYPDNIDLLLAGCKANSMYASFFVADQKPETARYLYGKAKLYGFRALSPQGEFQRSSAGNIEQFKSLLRNYGQKDVAALFWTASAWAGWIGADVTRVEALGDLPVLKVTLERLLELSPDYYFGGPHLLMGAYLAAGASALGGNLAEAGMHFEKALALNGNRSLNAKVMFAEYYAVGIKDRKLFEKTLEEVIAAPVDIVPELTLANVMAQEKAKRLLARVEEYFGTGL